MCDSSTQSVIDSIVDFKVQSGELFTAFDVSLEVQCNLKASGAFHSDNHRHRNIKNDVHKSIDRYLGNAQYERQLCDVGASTDAFVYYPQGCDPSSYVPLTRNDAPVSNSNPYVIILLLLYLLLLYLLLLYLLLLYLLQLLVPQMMAEQTMLVMVENQILVEQFAFQIIYFVMLDLVLAIPLQFILEKMIWEMIVL
jgi:hypothetical protein